MRYGKGIDDKQALFAHYAAIRRRLGAPKLLGKLKKAPPPHARIEPELIELLWPRALQQLRPSPRPLTVDPYDGEDVLIKRTLMALPHRPSVPVIKDAVAKNWDIPLDQFQSSRSPVPLRARMICLAICYMLRPDLSGGIIGSEFGLPNRSARTRAVHLAIRRHGDLIGKQIREINDQRAKQTAGPPGRKGVSAPAISGGIPATGVDRR